MRPAAGRPAEAVVVHDDCGLAPTELLVRDLTGAGVPLRAVAVIAEHVLRCDLQRRILRPGGADDERLRRMRLRVVRDVDRLVTRQRADHHVGLELLHQTTRLLDRGRHRVVAAAVADDLHGGGADADARHACRRLLRILHLAVCVVRECRLSAADVRLVAEPEAALAVGHDRDPDHLRLRRRERRRNDDSGQNHEHTERKRELPVACETTHACCPPWLTIYNGKNTW